MYSFTPEYGSRGPRNSPLSSTRRKRQGATTPNTSIPPSPSTSPSPSGEAETPVSNIVKGTIVWVYLQDVLEYFQAKYGAPAEYYRKQLEQRGVDTPYFLGNVMKLESYLVNEDESFSEVEQGASVAFVRLMDVQPFGQLATLFDTIGLSEERTIHVKKECLIKSHLLSSIRYTNGVSYDFLTSVLSRDGTPDQATWEQATRSPQEKTRNLTYLKDASPPEIMFTVLARYNDGYGQTFTGKDLISVKGPFPCSRSLNWPFYGPEYMIMARLRPSIWNVMETEIGSREMNKEPSNRFGPLREPHVFSVAERALFRMHATGRSQAIMLVGISGSGKTERLKNLFSYVCHLPSIDRFLRKYENFGFTPEDQFHKEMDLDDQLRETGLTQMAQRLKDMGVSFKELPSRVAMERQKTTWSSSSADDDRDIYDHRRSVSIPLSLWNRHDMRLPLETETIEFRLLSVPLILEPLSSCSTVENARSSRMSMVYELYVSSKRIPRHSEKLLGMQVHSALSDFKRPSIAPRVGYLCKEYLDEAFSVSFTGTIDSKSIEAEEAALYLNSLLSVESTYFIFYWMLAGMTQSEKEKLKLPRNLADATILTGLYESDLEWRSLNIDVAQTTRFTKEAIEGWKRQYSMFEQACLDMGMDMQKMDTIKQLLSAVVALGDVYVTSLRPDKDIVKAEELLFKPERRLNEAAQLLGITDTSLFELIVFHHSDEPDISGKKSVSVNFIQERTWEVMDIIYEVAWNFFVTNLNARFRAPFGKLLGKDYYILKIADPVGEHGCVWSRDRCVLESQKNLPSNFLQALARNLESRWPCGNSAQVASNYSAERMRELEQRRITASEEELMELLEMKNISRREMTDLLTAMYNPTKVSEAFDRQNSLFNLLDTLPERRQRDIDHVNRKVMAAANTHKDVMYTDQTRQTARKLKYSLWIKHSAGKVNYLLSQLFRKPRSMRFYESVLTMLQKGENSNFLKTFGEVERGYRVTSGGLPAQETAWADWQASLASTLSYLDVPKKDSLIVHCVRSVTSQPEKLSIPQYNRGVPGQREKLFSFLTKNMSSIFPDSQMPDPCLMGRQLKATSVSPHIRLRSHRISMGVSEFSERYSILSMPLQIVGEDTRYVVRHLLTSVMHNYKRILRKFNLLDYTSIGIQSILIEPEALFALELLKTHRFREMDDAATKIQVRLRAWAERRFFVRLLRSTILLQSAFRQWKCRHTFVHLRDAARAIEAVYLGYRIRTSYCALRKAVRAIQVRYKSYQCLRKWKCTRIVLRRLHALALGKYLRQEYLKKHEAAKVIERSLRKHYFVMRGHWRRVKAALLIQAFWRGQSFRNKHVNLMIVLDQRLIGRLTAVRLVKFQAHIRRRQCRRVFLYVRSCCVCIQHCVRKYITTKARIGAIRAAKDVAQFVRISLIQKRLNSTKEDMAISVNLLRIQKLQQRENRSRAVFNSRNIEKTSVYTISEEKRGNADSYFMNELVHRGGDFHATYRDIAGCKIFLQSPFFEVLADVSSSYPRGWMSGIGDLETHLRNKAATIVAIHCGLYHTVILDNEGKVYAFGLNDMGQCGMQSHAKGNGLVSCPKRIQVDSRYLPNLKTEAQTGELKFSSIATGIDHSIGLTSGGTVVGWGSNRVCQLGEADQRARSFCPKAIPFVNRKVIVEISSGARHSAARSSDGEVFVWGDRDACGLEGSGDQGSGGMSPLNVKYFHGMPIKQVSCGWEFTAVLSVKNEVFLWGSRRCTNYFPFIGQHRESGDPKPTEVWPAIKGDNTYQWQFLTSQRNRPNEVITEICCGGKHLLLLSNTHSVYALGSNAYGQCGYDRQKFRVINYPSRVFRFEEDEDVYGDENSLLLNRYVRSNLRKRRALSSGFRHSACILPSGNIVAWGAIGSMYVDSSCRGQGETMNTITHVPTLLRAPLAKECYTDEAFSVNSPCLSALFVRFKEAFLPGSPSSPGKVIREGDSHDPWQQQENDESEVDSLEDSSFPFKEKDFNAANTSSTCMADHSDADRFEGRPQQILDAHVLVKCHLQGKPFKATGAQINAVIEMLERSQSEPSDEYNINFVKHLVMAFVNSFTQISDGSEENTFALSFLLREVIRIVLRLLRDEHEFGPMEDTSFSTNLRLIAGEVENVLPDSPVEASVMDPHGFELSFRSIFTKLDFSHRKRLEDNLKASGDVDSISNVICHCIPPAETKQHILAHLTDADGSHLSRSHLKFDISDFLFCRYKVNELLGRWAVQSWKKKSRSYLNRLIQHATSTPIKESPNEVLKRFNLQITHLDGRFKVTHSRALLSLSSLSPLATEQRLMRFPTPQRESQELAKADQSMPSLLTGTPYYPFQLRTAIRYGNKPKKSNGRERMLEELSDLEKQLYERMTSFFGDQCIVPS